MKSAVRSILPALPVCAMTLLILDAKTALSGASDGLELCIRVVLPSLFPFIFLSVLLTGSLSGRRIPWLEPLGRLCGIPAGAEGLLAVGLMGGYPAGAQSIAQAYRNGSLSRTDAHRMLGFCSNAGPSFLFGILGTVFEPAALWALWGIHILSAILTGMLLPGRSMRRISENEGTSPTLPESLERSLKTMASVCGWVILFRVLLAFARRWFLWLLPPDGQILFSGLLELTNGCCLLPEASGPGARFVLASALLAFGGICVCLQTVSVTADLGTGQYFPGKRLQTTISLLLSLPAQRLLYPAAEQWDIHPALYLLPVAVLLHFLAKNTEIPGSIFTRQGV